MLNRKQIAAQLGIKPRLLGSKLSNMGFKPTKVEIQDDIAVHVYDEAAVAQIVAIYEKKKDKPNV